MKKYSLMLVIVAAILLEVMGGAQYFLATYGTEAELLDKASRDLDPTSKNWYMTPVEGKVVKR